MDGDSGDEGNDELMCVRFFMIRRLVKFLRKVSK